MLVQEKGGGKERQNTSSAVSSAAHNRTHSTDSTFGLFLPVDSIFVGGGKKSANSESGHSLTLQCVPPPAERGVSDQSWTTFFCLIETLERTEGRYVCPVPPEWSYFVP